MTTTDNHEFEKKKDDNNTDAMPDENMQLFVYGNILIKDPETGDVLVNKSF